MTTTSATTTGEELKELKQAELREHVSAPKEGGSINMIRLPLLSERLRKWGYIFWNKESDDLMKKFLNDARVVDVVLENAQLGEKNVNWQKRRISVGRKQAKRIPETATSLRLSLSNDGKLKITSE